MTQANSQRAFAVLEAIPCVLMLAAITLGLGAAFSALRRERELAEALERCAREAVLTRAASKASGCLEEAFDSSGIERRSWRASIADYRVFVDPRSGRLEGSHAREVFSAGSGMAGSRRSEPGILGRYTDLSIPAAPLEGFFPESRALVLDLFVDGRPREVYRIPFPVQ